MDEIKVSQPINTDLLAYYAQLGGVAALPESVEIQAELAQFQELVAGLVAGQHVLELACGEGAWTERLAQSAASVVATDLNPAAIARARARLAGQANITFAVRDAFQLAPAGTQPAEISDPACTMCFGALFWSHIKRQDQAGFLAQLGNHIGKDALLIMLDRNHIDGVSDPIARTDPEGNTYALHHLADGARFEIVSNHPTDSALRKKIGQSVRDLRIYRQQFFWMMTCRLK